MIKIRLIKETILCTYDVMTFAEGNNFGLSGQISQDINQLAQVRTNSGRTCFPFGRGMPSSA